uniref:hypothetical protein n=1 Tax=Alistipes sp. D31t1_170403_E11 TaxID=2787128 RepID=UPI001E529F93|nr:hypothetical protein [Alistipes sp. D31t1_170403_E11]
MDRHITIVPSQGLTRMRLSELVGRKGVIVEDLTQDRNDKGYMVQLYHPYLDETLWYIPAESAGCYE